MTSRRLLSSLLPLALTLALTACPDKPARAIAEAEAFTFQHRPTEALERYESALLLLAKKPGAHSEALLRRALMGAGNLSYLDLQQPRQAAGYFQSLLRLFPQADEAVEARLTLASIHRSLGDSQSAIAQLLSLCQDFPDHADDARHISLLARAYLAQGNYEQALVEVGELLRRHPESPLAIEAMMLRGIALGLLRRPEEAIEVYAAIAQRWPAAPLAVQARYEWAQLLIVLKRDREAEALLMEALRSHPQPAMIQRELAEIRERLIVERTTPLNSLQALSAGH